MQETSGSLNCTVPPATSEVITSVAIKAHQHVQLSAPVPPNLLLQAMKAAVQCMQVADGTVPAVSLVAMALLLCPGPAEEKKAYALMLIPNGMEVRGCSYSALLFCDSHLRIGIHRLQCNGHGSTEAICSSLL